MIFTHDFTTENLGDSYFTAGANDISSSGLRLISDPDNSPYVCKWFYPLSGFPTTITSITSDVVFGPNIESFLLGFKVNYDNKSSIQIVKLEWKEGTTPVNKIRTIEVNGPPHEYTDLCDLPTLSRDGTTVYKLSFWFNPATYSTRRVYIDDELIWQGNLIQTPTDNVADNSIEAKANVEDTIPTNQRWALIKNFRVNW